MIGFAGQSFFNGLFSLTNVPDNTTCNFLVVTVTDSNGSTVRQGIGPCPPAGSTMPLGVSQTTAKQTTAMIDAFADAGSDDPILAVFGLTIVRSPGVDTAELSTIASIANTGINGSGGFVEYLTNNGVTATQLASYRSAIVDKLADASAGYTKLMKEAVDNGISSGPTEEMKKRGEAAAKLLNVLVEAASSAGFDENLVLEAFNAMGSVVMPLFNTAVGNGSISAATMQSINSTVGTGIDKLRADKEIESYTNAFTVLNRPTYASQFATAATTLTTAMRAAFQDFEQVFDGSETDTEVQTAESTMQTAMQAAFNTFLSNIAASNAQITSLVTTVNTVLSAGGSPGSVSANEFKTYNSNGASVNWPISSVAVTEWVSDAITQNSYDLNNTITYTRDTTAIPSTVTWIGSCSVNPTTLLDKASCVGGGGAWTPGRTDFINPPLSIPGSYAALFGIQEDIMILEFTRYEAMDAAQTAFQAAGGTADAMATMMSAMKTAEKNFTDGLASLASNISGAAVSSPDGDAITTAEKKALVKLCKMPQL